MSEEKRKEKHQEIKTPTRLSKFLGITSFVLALLSFTTIMLYSGIGILIELPQNFLGFSPVVFFELFPCGLLDVLAFILGCCAYLRIDTQMNPLLKRFAVWGIILSLFYWVLYYIMYSVFLDVSLGYGWYN